MFNKVFIGITATTVLFSVLETRAQGGLSVGTKSPSPVISGQSINAISTAVPFLTIAPDARAAGMGDAGVASSPDASSIHWNASKLAFADKQSAVSISYTPWLKGLVNDIYLAYVSYYYKIDKRQAVATSLRYFSLGEINFTDATGQSIGNYNPNEFAFDIAYSRVLSANFAGGVALRYIRSSLTQGVSTNGTATNAGQAIAGDISGYYFNDVEIHKQKTRLAAGFNISNIGNKITYSDAGTPSFLPINLRIGGSAKINLDEYNTITVMLDANKLLVPTPNPNRDPNPSVVSGMLESFNDAPGGVKEELREIIYNPGVEYWYDNQFAVRAGYFYEDDTKGGRKYYTMGVGIRYNVFGLDLSYLIPATTTVKSPLENTLRFSLIFIFEGNAKSQQSSN